MAKANCLNSFCLLSYMKMYIKEINCTKKDRERTVHLSLFFVFNYSTSYSYSINLKWWTDFAYLVSPQYTAVTAGNYEHSAFRLRKRRFHQARRGNQQSGKLRKTLKQQICSRLSPELLVLGIIKFDYIQLFMVKWRNKGASLQSYNCD